MPPRAPRGLRHHRCGLPIGIPDLIERPAQFLRKAYAVAFDLGHAVPRRFSALAIIASMRSISSSSWRKVAA